MPTKSLILPLVLTSVLLAQNAAEVEKPGQKPVAATLTCPSSNQPVQDPITFAWTKAVNISKFRLMLGPAEGSNRDGDTSLINAGQAQFAGLPGGQTLYVTLWSYDSGGNPVQPPSYCRIKTAATPGMIGFKDQPKTFLSGISLGDFPVSGSIEASPDASADAIAAAARSCQARCKQNAGCQGYTYYPAGPGNPAALCELRSQITAAQANECCLSALKIVTNEAAPAPPPAVSAAPPAPVPPSPPSPPASPAAPAAMASAAKAAAKGINGDWVNQFGAVTHIQQKGNTITGTYSDAKQQGLSGSVQGTFDGKTLKATLNWKNGTDSSHGSLLLTMTADGKLDGTWTDAAGVSGPWTMGAAAPAPGK